MTGSQKYMFKQEKAPKATPFGEGVGIYRYIYIYMCAVKLKTGPRFGGLKLKNWSKFKVKNWSKFFFTVFPSFIVFFGHF